MLETLLIGGIAVGLGRGADGRWSWTKERAEHRLRSAADRLAPWLDRVRAALPGTLDRCLDDVRSLAVDLVGALDPKTRRVVRQRIGPLIEPPTRPAEPVAPRPDRHALEYGPRRPDPRAAGATGALRALQDRYLEGAISLDQYRREVRRLRAEPLPAEPLPAEPLRAEPT